MDPMDPHQSVFRFCIYPVEPGKVRLSFNQPVVPPELKCKLDDTGKHFDVEGIEAGSTFGLRYRLMVWLINELRELHQALCLTRVEQLSPLDLMITHALPASNITAMLRSLMMEAFGRSLTQTDTIIETNSNGVPCGDSML